MNIILDLVHRSMKHVMIRHAKDSGADSELLASLEKMDYHGVLVTVKVLYGEPECFNKK